MFVDPDLLQYGKVCERCGNRLVDDGPAVICSFECTFCTDCGLEMENRCPNCSGDLVPRPRRSPS